MREYEFASHHGAAALAPELAEENHEVNDAWSVDEAERAFFRRLEAEKASQGRAENGYEGVKQGQRFVYRPSQIRWREVWMPFAAAVLLAVALGIVAYRGGVSQRLCSRRTTPGSTRESR